MIVQLPELVSAPRRAHFEAWTRDGKYRGVAFASTSPQVRRYFAKLWNVRASAITVGARPDLNR